MTNHRAQFLHGELQAPIAHKQASPTFLPILPLQFARADRCAKRGADGPSDGTPEDLRDD